MKQFYLQAGSMKSKVDRKTHLLWPLLDPKNQPVKLQAAAFFTRKLLWFTEQHPEIKTIVTADALIQENLEPKYYAPMFSNVPDNFSVPPAWHEKHPPATRSVRIIVAGSKGYDSKDEFAKRMEALTSNLDLSDVEIVYGDERGVGVIADEWAAKHNIVTRLFEAHWEDLDAPGAFIKTGKSSSYNTNAGTDRNALMGLYGTHLVAFPAEAKACSATQGMLDIAEMHRLKVRTIKPMEVS